MFRSYSTSRLFFIILAVAVMVRLLCYVALRDKVYVTDDFVMRYDQVADNLLTSKGFLTDIGRPASNAAPLYPFALACLYFVFGHSLLAVRIFSILIDAVAAALMAVSAKEVFDSKSGFWAGLVASLQLFKAKIQPAIQLLTLTKTTIKVTTPGNIHAYMPEYRSV